MKIKHGYVLVKILTHEYFIVEVSQEQGLEHLWWWAKDKFGNIRFNALHYNIHQHEYIIVNNFLTALL